MTLYTEILSIEASLVITPPNVAVSPNSDRQAQCRRRSSRACAVEASSDDGGETLMIRMEPIFSNAGPLKVERECSVRF